jgi:hypothetical protein
MPPWFAPYSRRDQGSEISFDRAKMKVLELLSVAWSLLLAFVQGLKPLLFLFCFGTTKVVPCYKAQIILKAAGDGREQLASA